MQLDIIMPALGMSQDKGVLLAWHKESGDPVSKGDILLEVETDKTTVEIEAEQDGFLVDVQAAAGEEVPVGQVIARISDSAESSAPAAASDQGSSADSAPEVETVSGEEIIMPTLGMSQDSGLLVNWLKEPGEAVAEGDPIFEVETDKSVVEVASEFSGFLAGRLAQAGENVPTGETIAIISAEKPENPVDRGYQASAASAPAQSPEPAAETKAAASESESKAAKKPTNNRAKKPKTAGAKSSNGRILASPKAKRLAALRDLDLQLLVDAGLAQPFLAADVESFEEPAASGQAATAANQYVSRRLVAAIDEDRSGHFIAWATKRGLGIKDPQAVLAGLAAASWGKELSVAIESFENSRTFVAQSRLGSVVEEESDAQLLIRDLRESAIQTVEYGAQEIPAITITEAGGGVQLTLEYLDHQLSAAQATQLISGLAGRLKEPLRHIL